MKKPNEPLTLRKLCRLKLSDKLTEAKYKGVRAITVDELLTCKIPPRPNIMGGFLKKAGRVLIAGPAGIGKTHLGLAIAAHVSVGKSLMGWEVDKPRRVVYIDGEMAPAQLKRRVKRWARRLQGLRGNGNFRVAPFTVNDGCAIDLTAVDGQGVMNATIGKDVDLVVIDNYSAFNPNGREDAEAWAPLDLWLKRLSRKGIASILVHHSGKGRSASYRGTSRLVGPVDTFISLSRVDGAQPTGAAEFEMRFEKTRDRARRENVAPKHVKLLCKKKSGYQFVAEPLQDQTHRATEIQRMIGKGFTDSKIAKKLNINRSTVCRHRKKSKK